MRGVALSCLATGIVTTGILTALTSLLVLLAGQP